MKTLLLETLNDLRKQVDEMWPEDCCPKGVMRESNGRETLLCVDACPWCKLELLIASAMVDAEILEKKNVSP